MKKHIWWIIAVVVVLAVLLFLQLETQTVTDDTANTQSQEEPMDSGVDVVKIANEVVAGEAVLLDVRTTEELEEDGYALNSTHFDLALLETGQLPDIATDMTVYTYCKGGVRAGKAEEILETAGFTNVENIGGLSDWAAAGGVVVKQ